MLRRRDSVEATRDRIVAAAFDLHATIGPARTSISAIAEQAGVQRHTVYAHFPSLGLLYEACTAHGIGATRMPHPEPWSAIQAPSARLRTGLAELFAWYRSNERMLRNVLIEEPADEPAEEPAEEPGEQPGGERDPYAERMAAILDTLADGWAIRGTRRRRVLGAVLAHAVAFETWRSLTGAGLSDREAVDLLVRLARSVANPSRSDGAPTVGG